MRITVKGQVTIPLEYRKKFGFKPGTELEFIESPEGCLQVRQKKQGKSPVDHWLKRAVGRGKQKVTTAEIMKMTRQ